MITIAIIAGGLIYTAFIGVAWEMLRERAPDEVAHGCGALLWPLVLPAMLGARAFRRLTTPRQRELPAAVVRERRPRT